MSTVNQSGVTMTTIDPPSANDLNDISRLTKNTIIIKIIMTIACFSVNSIDLHRAELIIVCSIIGLPLNVNMACHTLFNSDCFRILSFACALF